MPAAPDHAEPGSGQDADRVGMVLAAGDGVVVDLRGPGVGSSGVAGEVADGVAELLVDRPAEADGLVLAGLAGRGCDAGQAGQGGSVGEPAADIADLGEESGGAYGWDVPQKWCLRHAAASGHTAFETTATSFLRASLQEVL